MSCTTADSDSNAESHGLNVQFVQPHTQHDAPYAADYREKLHWPPRKEALHWTGDEKRIENHEEAEPVITVKNELHRIKDRIHEGGDKVDDDWLEKTGSWFPVLQKAPLAVQVIAILQLCVAFAALGGQCSDVCLF